MLGWRIAHNPTTLKNHNIKTAGGRPSPYFPFITA